MYPAQVVRKKVLCGRCCGVVLGWETEYVNEVEASARLALSIINEHKPDGVQFAARRAGFG